MAGGWWHGRAGWRKLDGGVDFPICTRWRETSFTIMRYETFPLHYQTKIIRSQTPVRMVPHVGAEPLANLRKAVRDLPSLSPRLCRLTSYGILPPLKRIAAAFLTNVNRLPRRLVTRYCPSQRRRRYLLPDLDGCGLGLEIS